ncbi:hypothetical protein WICPIJ_003191 [Wickerhamomyces pijperi]|uniref:37S ribosomal protein S25, mitochondrial n=1 Tax=Wickerhamomyces pijperi TaxID=599730 RepID=A0A9P8Q7K2_WICPI|nr:hypothetical protein WICPIJ_003191 [Wickerhamomyces pijperi]
MKPQTGAVNVLERTSHYLKSGVLRNKPVWLQAVANNPPTKNFLKEPKTLKLEQSIKVDREILPNPNAPLYNTKSKNTAKSLYKIPKLNYVEDELREIFYKQHPWELSRPKILLENSGNDAKTQDWSKLTQINKQLDGESVIQRAIYLINNESKTLKEAYEQSRFEFYRLRIQQELEEQISKEENSMFGASYDVTPVEFGLAKEQEFIDKWVVDATELTKISEANKSNVGDV